MLSWVLELIVPVLLPLAISAVYFLRSPSNQALFQRMLVSAHGLSISVIYLSATAISWTKKADSTLGRPFAIALVIPLVLIVIFALYRGRRTTHWFQVLNFVCLAWVSFVGGMAITGDWL